METQNNNLHLEEKTVAELVTQDFKKAEIFKRHNIDFCCGGKKTLHEVCAQKNIDFDTLKKELLQSEEKKLDSEQNFNDWDLNSLIDYIIDTHHVYVRESSPILNEFSNKVARVHGELHPEVVKINQLLNTLTQEMESHMKKEEIILFPYIKQLLETVKENNPEMTPPLQTVENPIRAMEEEHKAAGDSMSEIRNLSSNYTPPENACNTYKALYFKLKEFEEDLHKHIHLENNILFPKAIKLEVGSN